MPLINKRKCDKIAHNAHARSYKRKEYDSNVSVSDNELELDFTIKNISVIKRSHRVFPGATGSVLWVRVCVNGRGM